MFAFLFFSWLLSVHPNRMTWLALCSVRVFIFLRSCFVHSRLVACRAGLRRLYCRNGQILGKARRAGVVLVPQRRGRVAGRFENIPKNIYVQTASLRRGTQTYILHTYVRTDVQSYVRTHKRTFKRTHMINYTPTYVHTGTYTHTGTYVRT